MARTASSSSQESEASAALTVPAVAWRPASAHQWIARSRSSGSMSAIRAETAPSTVPSQELAVAGAAGAWSNPTMRAEEKEVGRWVVGLVKALRWVLWILLFASVVATLEGLPALRDASREGRLPAWLSFIPVVLVGAFIAGYALYRFTLVRAGRYPAGKAMMQIVLMSLFLALLVRWGGDRDAAAVSDRPVDLGHALTSREPELRALAAEVLRGRPRAEALTHVDRLVELLADPSAEVRRQAHASLVALAGRDLGEGAAAADRWRAALAAPR